MGFEFYYADQNEIWKMAPWHSQTCKISRSIKVAYEVQEICLMFFLCWSLFDFQKMYLMVFLCWSKWTTDATKHCLLPRIWSLFTDKAIVDCLLALYLENEPVVGNWNKHGTLDPTTRLENGTPPQCKQILDTAGVIGTP